MSDVKVEERDRTAVGVALLFKGTEAQRLERMAEAVATARAEGYAAGLEEAAKYVEQTYDWPDHAAAIRALARKGAAHG